MTTTIEDKIVWIVLPFKDEKHTGAVRRQLKELSSKININVQPVYKSPKLVTNLRYVKKSHPWTAISVLSIIINAICVIQITLTETQQTITPRLGRGVCLTHCLGWLFTWIGQLLLCSGHCTVVRLFFCVKLFDKHILTFSLSMIWWCWIETLCSFNIL